MRTTRRAFLQGTGIFLLVPGGPRAEAAQPSAPYEVSEKTIAELQAAMASGRVTSVQLVEAYLERIRAYDQAGPRLNSVLYVNPNAAAAARMLDEERRKKGARGPLHGIPVLLKDNFDTKDMPTTGGCIALSGAVPRDDAFQVARLRRAGVVFLGKVNLHELALGLTTVSSLGGQTLNPYDPARAPGGSSGGSGVAVAANLAAFAMGTDTSGSIRIPSSHNSIVGLRPSAGLSSRAGIIPFGHTQDTGGPMARTVSDIAVVLDATAGADPADPITGTSKGKVPRSYRSALKVGALKGARIGVLRELFGNAPEDEEVAAVVRRAVDEMKMRGATAVDVTVPNLGQQLAASNLLTQELKFYLRDYLKSSPGAHVKSLEELLASGLHTAQFQAFVEGANALPENYLGGDDYKSRLAAREALRAAIVTLMDGERLDVIVYPTVRRVAPMVGGNQLGSNAGLSAQTGLPAMSVPAGFTKAGFPVGVEMLGRPFSESTLLGLAYAYEQATHHRRAPATTPPLSRAAGTQALEPAGADTGSGSVTMTVNAVGAQSIPPSSVPFEATVRFSLNRATRQLGFETSVSGASDEILGIYLHRRANRPNGGVAWILAKAPTLRSSGRIELTDAELTDLEAGKFYVSAIARKDPRQSARANVTFSL